MPKTKKELKEIEEETKEVLKKKTSSKSKITKKTEDKPKAIKKASAESKTKKSATKKTTTTMKKADEKTEKAKATTKKTGKKEKETKPIAKKTTIKGKTKKAEESKKIKTVSKTSVKKSDENVKHEYLQEYYDLPYKYNKTVIKALVQNPNTLFVYWEISDEDVQNIKDNFGEDIFYTTKPVLIIHNLTDKYSFEIDINDFANNWYIHVNDTKCQYVIELGRRPKEGEVNHFPDNYLYVTSSNMIESPNDHVLFYDSEQFRQVRFKNIHTNKYTTRVIKPFLKNMYELYRSLHLDKENVSFDFKNPSSQNPTSNVY